MALGAHCAQNISSRRVSSGPPLLQQRKKEKGGELTRRAGLPLAVLLVELNR